MSRRRYRVANYPMVTTAAPTPVTTGTAIKTMLQIKPSLGALSIIQWGFKFDVVPTAVVKTELLVTGAIAATVTAHVAAGVQMFDDGSNPAGDVTLGTAATGYTASAEGTIVASRTFDERWAWEQAYDIQFPLEREPQVLPTEYLRIRMTTATAINALCYVIFEE